MSEDYYYQNRPLDRVKRFLKKTFDRMPLGALFIVNGFFLAYWFIDIIPAWDVPGGDPIPVFDEMIKTVALFYYNAYLLKRTFGVLNPIRILQGQTPMAKRRIGILPYEESMDHVFTVLKRMKKAAKSSEIPGFDAAKVEKLAREIKLIGRRLSLLDRLLSSPPFQKAPVRAEIERLKGLTQAAEDPALVEDFEKAVAHAENYLSNIDRLREERNRMVAKLDRLRLQLDETHSRLLAMSVSGREEDAQQMLDELFGSVSNFDSTLEELENLPGSELYRKAMEEIGEVEEKARGEVRRRERDKA